MKNSSFQPVHDEYSGNTHYRLSARLERIIDEDEPRYNQTNRTPFRRLHVSFEDPAGRLHKNCLAIIYDSSLDWAKEQGRPVEAGKDYMVTAIPMETGTTLLKMAPFELGQVGIDFELFSQFGGEDAEEIAEAATAKVVDSEEVFDDEF